MRVLSVEPFDRAALLSALRRTRICGFGGAQPYRDATLELTAATPADALVPAQRYVLRAGVRTILDLRAALLAHGVDLFALDGGAYVRASDAPDALVPVIPPIVEESREPDGSTVLIVGDGIHRVLAARAAGLPIATVVVRGVAPEYPYYARALAGGWADVVELEQLPDRFEKKAYRNPDDPRALFRDFNAVFPGVQKPRRDTDGPRVSAVRRDERRRAPAR